MLKLYNNFIIVEILIFRVGNKVPFCYQDRRGKFQEELLEHSKQLEEFVAFGDVAELHEYQKRALALYTKLDEAAQYTDQINKEEEALGWNTTHYPLRKQVWNTTHYPLRKQVWNTTHYPLRKQVWNTTHFPLREQVWNTTHFSLRKQVWNTTHYPLRKQVWNTTHFTLRKHL